MKKLVAIILLFTISCSTLKHKKSEGIYSINKILTIKEYNYSFLFEAVNSISNDTISIISLKNNFYEKHNIPKPISDCANIIKVGDNVEFYLTDILFSGNLLGQPGVSIKVEDEILWSGDEIIKDKYFGSTNTVGICRG